MSYTLTPSLPQTLLSAVTTGTGGVLLIKGNCERLTVAVTCAGTVSAGRLVIEEAIYDDKQGQTYTGTWSALPVTSTVSYVDLTALTGGATQVIHYIGSFYAIRARVSVDLTGGGTVTCQAWGN